MGYIIIGAAAGLICLAVIAGARYYLSETFNRIERILSGAYKGGEGDTADDRQGIRETRESRLYEELKRLIGIVKADYEKAEAEKQAVQALVSDLSHQLKTPLSNLIMYTEFLSEESLSEEEKGEFIKRLQEQAGKIQWIMDGLIKMSRLETGMIQFKAGSRGIRETLAECIGAVYPLAEKKRVAIRTEVFPELQLIHNRKWTAEALINVLENAVKYTPPDGSISISVTPLELYARIDIKDTGIGISPEEFNLIFQRFYRGRQSTDYEGTGIGLYLARLILEKEGGYIMVSSFPGEGSCFSIYLLKERVLTKL